MAIQKPEYIEGPLARENFEEGMKTLFKVPKDKVVPLKKSAKAASVRKPKKSDKD